MKMDNENNYGNNNHNSLQALELSTNVNDYDTGEPILDGSIRKTLIKYNNQEIENTILCELNSIKVDSKYHAYGISENIIV
jgi:hypothetical protein